MREPLVILTALLLAGHLSAQRSREGQAGLIAVGISVGEASFGAAARGETTTGEAVRFSPYRPTMWGLRIGYGRTGARVAISAGFGHPGIIVNGIAETALVSEDAFHLAAYGASFSAPLVRLRGGPVLRGLGGIRLERWAAPNEPTRQIIGGFGGLAMEVELTRTIAASLEGELGVTPRSPFRSTDLPDELTPRATWRRSLALAISWRP